MKWFKRDIIVLISFLILFVLISFQVNIGKEISLSGFRNIQYRCFNSHNDASQVAQQNVSIVAHTRHRKITAIAYIFIRFNQNRENLI